MAPKNQESSKCANSVDVATIDIGCLFETGRAEEKRQIAKQIHDICRGHGFFYVSNHGINVQEFYRVTNEFHAKITPEEKFDLAINAYNKTNSRVRSGYYMAIPDKKAVESFCILNPEFTETHEKIQDATPLHEVNIWPDSSKHPEFRAFFESHYKNMFNLSAALLKAFALALDKPESFFEEYFRQEDTLSAATLIRYPYLDNYPPRKLGPDGVELSFQDHLDVSLITVLLQSPVPNLQVETPEGWKDVPTDGDNFLINCGTYMPYITKGYFPAPNHRVKWNNAERLSLPFFVNLGYDSKIQPFSPSDDIEEGKIDATNTWKKNDGDEAVQSYGEYFYNAFYGLIKKNGQT